MHLDPQALLLDAVAFAAHKHRNQRRKDAEASPYINHPIALASVLKREGVDDVAVLCAALLHDTIEDPNTTADELRVAFGEVITSVVLEVLLLLRYTSVDQLILHRHKTFGQQ